MARRRSDITARMHKIRGLDFSEKQTLVRIGELADALINNRGPTNPGFDAGPESLFVDPTLPVPTNVQVRVNTRSANIVWDATDSSKLNSYRLSITSLSTGTTTSYTAYSNSFNFSNQTGTFTGTLQSVGRGGRLSGLTSFEFTIPGSVILLEGTKNGDTTVSSSVSETIYCPQGYKIFGWVSFVIDSFWDSAGPTDTQVDIYVGDTFATATLLSSFNLAEEEHTVTNLPNSGPYAATRPGGAPARTGNKQTTLCGAFGPFDVEGPIIANEYNRFWGVVSNRTTENDVIGLAINLFTSTGGTGTVSNETFEQQANCVRFDNVTTAAGFHFTPATPTANLDITESFTYVAWVKIESANLGTAINDGTTPLLYVYNSSAGLYTLTIGLSAGTSVPSDSAIRRGLTVTLTDLTNYKVYTAFNSVLPSHGRWCMLAVTWDTTTLKLYVNGVQQPTNKALDQAIGSLSTAFNSVTQLSGPNGLKAVTTVKHLHTALWSAALSAAAIAELYNGGAAINYRTDTGSYTQSPQLKHWWRTGFDTSSFFEYGRDRGFSTLPINISEPGLEPADVTLVGDTIGTYGFAPQTTCVQNTAGSFKAFVGDFGLTTRDDVLVGNAWTMTMWMKPDSATTAGFLYDTTNSGVPAAANRRRMQLLNTGALRVSLANTAGGNFKVYDYNNFFSGLVNTWVFIALRWDGTTLSLFRNGSAVVPDVLVTDVAGTQAATTRARYTWGNDGNAGPTAGFSGRMHSHGLWSIDLFTNEIVSLYNAGNGATVNYRESFGNYISGSYLHTWLRPGACGTSTALGTAYLFGANYTAQEINLNSNINDGTLDYIFSNFTSGDLVSDDYPSA